MRTQLQKLAESTSPSPLIIGDSPEIKTLFRLIDKVARTEVTVLIQGESGTGKELVAKTLHEKSLHRDNPFIAFNCSVVPEALFESELFGHEEGAFTGATVTRKGRFELAEGGTIFVDEIGELSLDNQVKFLRVLQEKEFEKVGGTVTKKMTARVLAATNKNLKKLVENGRFREDLFYRLHFFPISLPPLRDRKSDIPDLANHCIKVISKQMNMPPKSLSPKAMKLLQDYSWPGNVRELQNILTRVFLLCEQETITESLIMVPSDQNPSIIQKVAGEFLREEELLKLYAKEVYKHCDYKKKKAAEILGITYKTFLTRLK